MNLCIFTGRLTATPELKATPKGKKVCSFTLAVDKRFSNSNGEKEVSYIDFVAWEHNAVFVSKWFDKGVKIAVTSECQPRPYTDKDGNKRKVTEFLVSTVEFADGKREANADANTFTTDTNTFATADTNDDFVPVENGDGFPWS